MGLALLCQSQERYDEAESLLNKALAVERWALGVLHPNTELNDGRTG